ncbi:multinuclear nonheme iron-dependent oxidase, partial [Acinetobacter guillouiae]|uniref:multinuclear nonheme iron-dependent oxidase n=1 Tax=Acinetobacter guillouiae TaxID=106649 RepID=UPI001250B72B
TCVEKSPLVCHGLSLSMGGPHPLNLEFIHKIKAFLNTYNVSIYSEHLSYSHDGGYLYDLLPIPMTQDAVRYVAERILRVQDILGQKLVIENVSTYLMPGAEMTEAEFIVEVIKQADCELLLDVNNVYVNSINHGTDAQAFICAMPQDKIRY